MKWKKVKVSDFAEVSTGGTPSTSKEEYWEGGEIPWLNSGELNQDVITTCDNYITEEGLKSSSARMMPPDTVLIALTGTTTGKTAYLTFDACANQSVTGILPSEKHFPKYLYHYLSSIRKEILNDSYGGAQKHISQAYVKKLEIPLPSLPTQQKIAAILDSADALRQKDKQLLAQYDALAQSVFYTLFGDPLQNEKGWEVKKLGDVSEKITDGEYITPQRQDAGIKLLSARNIKNGYLDFEAGLDFISEEEYKRIAKRCNPLYGDILISCSGSVGRVCAIRTNERFNLVRSVALVKHKREILDGSFLESMLQSDFLQNQIRKSSKTSSQSNLFTGPIKNLDILVPPLKLQTQFATIISKIEEQKHQATKQLQKSEELFQSLLQKAFKGELVE